MGYEFFGEKIIFPFALVPGINNDQSLNQFCPLLHHFDVSVGPPSPLAKCHVEIYVAE